MGTLIRVEYNTLIHREKMMNSNKIKCNKRKAKFIEAFEQQQSPTVLSTAIALGYEPRSVRRWISNDPNFRAAVLKVIIKNKIDSWRQALADLEKQRAIEASKPTPQAKPKRAPKIPVSLRDLADMEIADRFYQRMMEKKGQANGAGKKNVSRRSKRKDDLCREPQATKP